VSPFPLADQLGGLAHDLVAVERRDLAPLLETLLGGGECTVKVGPLGMRHLADHLFGRGIDDWDRPALGALGPGAVDHQGDVAIRAHELPPLFPASAMAVDNALPAHRSKSAKAGCPCGGNGHYTDTITV